MEQGQNYHYYAFISYSHKDAAWAKWIQEAIERYRLPAIVRKEVKKPLPKKIQPVFLDQTDLGAGKLMDNLHQELERSRFLIVVCSPNSAQPNTEGRHFIEEEVCHFCRLGREKQIVPVIVQGTPESAFCPKLKELDMLALDATKEPKPRLLNDLVATILGLRRDELWRREQRRISRRRITMATVICMILTVISMTALCIWDYEREVKKYYSADNVKFGMDFGAGEMSNPESCKLPRYYAFAYRGYDRPPLFGGHRVLRCVYEIESSIGRVVRGKRYFYEDGRLSRIDQVDGSGTILEKQLYEAGITNSCEMIVYENGRPKYRAGERLFVDFDDETGIMSRARSRHFDGRYEVVSNEYADGQKFELREFFNADGTRGCDQYGTPIKLHKSVANPSAPGGYLEVAQLYFDAKTNRFVNAQGVSGLVYNWNPMKRMREAVYIDIANQPVDSIEGYAIEQIELDDAGRMICCRWLNGPGEKVMQPRLGCYGISNDYYCASGQLAAQTFVDKDGNPMFSDVLGFAVKKLCYSNNVVCTRFYDTTNALCMMQNGTFGFDEEHCDDRVTARRYIGRDGLVCTNVEGVATRYYKYDSLGRLQEEKFVLGGGKTGRISYTYDEVGNVIRETELPEARINLGQDVKYYCEKRAPDGRLAAVWFYDAERRLRDGALGFARQEISYNCAGEWCEVIHYGANKSLALNKMLGYSKMVRIVKHVEEGIFVEERAFDDKHMAVSNRASAVNARYTQAGQLIEIKAMDAVGRPARIGDMNVSCVEVSRDEYGRVAMISYTPLGADDAHGALPDFKFEYLNERGDVKVKTLDRKGIVTSEKLCSVSELRRVVLKPLDVLAFSTTPHIDVLMQNDPDIKSLTGESDFK